MLTLPHSNPECEHIFNYVTKTHIQFKSQFSFQTLESLLTVISSMADSWFQHNFDTEFLKNLLQPKQIIFKIFSFISIYNMHLFLISVSEKYIWTLSNYHFSFFFVYIHIIPVDHVFLPYIFINLWWLYWFVNVFLAKHWWNTAYYYIHSISEQIKSVVCQ